MKNAKIGIINIAGLAVPPEKHEYNTAKYFADRGLDVIFIPPHHIKGVPNPDFRMAGKVWETKSPEKFSKSTFEHNLKRATTQSCHIIFDLRRLKSDKNEQLYLAEIRKCSSWRKIETLLVIQRSEELLTIKGRFDNI